MAKGPSKPRSATLAPEDRELFEREARPHLDTLYGAALRLTRSSVDAEDLVQDTLVRAYRFYDRFEAGTNFKAWLLRIQMNTFVNRYRRTTRERAVFDGAMARPVGEGAMSRASMRALTDPVSDAHRSLIAAEIAAAFDDLSEEARTIVLLSDVEELSYKEIAEIVGCPIGTVMSRLHRARRHLRAVLQDHAVELGIVEEQTQPEEDASLLSLDEFRHKKGMEQ